MSNLDYGELQRRYGGRYIARRNGEVIAVAETYDELSDQLASAAISQDDCGDFVVEYVEPAGTIGVY